MLHKFLKRGLDLFCCFIAVPVFGPIMVFIAFAIMYEDGGPVFYHQFRRGKNKKAFRCWKFRTMRDGKVTKVGRIIRNTGLDELGQVINILKGDMTVVGPRPLTEEDICRLEWDQEDDRWSVKPGITGLAQLQSGISAQHSLAADFQYIAEPSISLDLRIIMMSLCINLIGKRRFRRVTEWRKKSL